MQQVRKRTRRSSGTRWRKAPDSTGDQLIGPGYRSPRSIQINAGIQHQFGHGTVLTADYVRNVSTRYLIGLDTNKQGDARFLNVANAQNAISATNAQFWLRHGLRLRLDRLRHFQGCGDLGLRWATASIPAYVFR